MAHKQDNFIFVFKDEELEKAHFNPIWHIILQSYPFIKSPKIYRPFRLGDSHPLYTYPPVTDFPTWWLYANMGRTSSVLEERDTPDLTKISCGRKTSFCCQKQQVVKYQKIDLDFNHKGSSKWSKKLTQRGILAQFDVIALKALLRSPPIVSSVHNNVNFFISVLTNVSTEYTTPAVAAHRVSTVYGASPHVSDPVCKDLWPCIWVSKKRVVRGDSVLPSSVVTPIHVNAENFSQKSTPG